MVVTWLIGSHGLCASYQNIFYRKPHEPHTHTSLRIYEGNGRGKYFSCGGRIELPFLTDVTTRPTVKLSCVKVPDPIPNVFLRFKLQSILFCSGLSESE